MTTNYESMYDCSYATPVCSVFRCITCEPSTSVLHLYFYTYNKLLACNKNTKIKYKENKTTCNSCINYKQIPYTKPTLEYSVILNKTHIQRNGINNMYQLNLKYDTHRNRYHTNTPFYMYLYI